MPDIFNSQPGSVAVVTTPKALPAQIWVDGFEPKACLLSGMNVKQAVNVQFQVSLDEAVYVYIFGDRVGASSVSGLIFPKMCQGTKSGFEEVLNFYKANRASIKGAEIKLTIGGALIKGYLIELALNSIASSFDVVAPVSEFHLTFSTLPPE